MVRRVAAMEDRHVCEAECGVKREALLEALQQYRIALQSLNTSHHDDHYHKVLHFQFWISIDNNNRGKMGKNHLMRRLVTCIEDQKLEVVGDL